MFIDIASIDSAASRPNWLAHNQFIRHFALPLLLYRQFGHDYRGDFLADLEGANPDAAYRMTGWARRWLPPFLFLVTVPHLLRRIENKRGPAFDHRLQAPSSPDPERDRYILSRLMRRLERLIERLEPRARPSDWTGYEADNSYPAVAATLKQEFVAQACSSLKPARMINLGCNLGKFDLIAAENGAEVLAIDLDLASVDVL
ncbi:MAG TPA: hypothetical protein VN742_07585 [Candidatus Binataceae bacterium]|nr:hypothetical protein [Candidatus Binataceae bacterium]